MKPRLEKLTTSLVLALALVGWLAAPTVAAAQSGQIPEPPEGMWTTPADPADAPDAPLDLVMPVDPTIIIDELDNGLRYFIRENQYPAGRADLRLVVKTGSLMEDDDQLGLAHFVEHMAFNGTATYPKQALISALESFGMRFGAHINAYTSFDETVYMLHIPTDQEVILATAFQVLEDWASQVSFEGEEIDKERGVVIEEWRLGLGAGSRLRDQQFPILFGGSRYAERVPIGTLDGLQNFSHEAARRFYHDWYRPDLMAVIAVGDFDKNDVERRIREHFADLEGSAEPRPRVTFDIPEHDDTRFGIMTDPEVQTSVVQVFHKMPIRQQGTHGTYRQSIVEGLYMSMLNRRLRELSQQQNAPFLGAQASQGIFTPTREVYSLGAAVADGGVERGLEAVFEESARIAQQGFTATEFDREKRQLLRAFERIYTEKATQPSQLFVEEFQRAFLENESVPGIDYEWALYQRFIPDIALEDVNGVGAQWVSDTNRVVLVTAPAKEGLELPTEDSLMAALDRAGNRQLMAYVDTTTNRPLISNLPRPGEIVETETFDEVGVTAWTLSNGVRVVVKPTDLREDQVLFRAFSPGGTSLAGDEDYIAAVSAVNVISASGFGGFSPRMITNMLADKVVTVSPSIGSLEEGFNGGASPRDLEQLFQLIWLKFTSPQADPGTFELITEQMRASLANTNVTPEAAFQETMQRTLTQDHFRRRPLSADLVDEMDLDKSFDFYTDRFADASDFTFVFVGNVDLAFMRPLVARYLGSLPSIDREETWRDEGIVPPRGVIRRTVNRGLEPKSLTGIVFTGTPAEETSADDGSERARGRAMSAMATVLQTRLREVLREDLGGTYSVQVNDSLARRPRREYQISILFGCDPDRVDELVEVVFAEIEKLRESGPTQQEVDTVVAQARRSFETRVRQNAFWLGGLASAFRNGDDPNEIATSAASVDGITVESVQAAAKTYFDLGNYVQVTLLPEGSR